MKNVRHSREQGKFWEMHDLLFENRSALDRPNLDVYARDLGLDVERFDVALDTGERKAAADAETAEAKRFGVPGTPCFFINGRFLAGTKPLEAFTKRVDAAIAEADVAIAAGASPAHVYEALVRDGKPSVGGRPAP